MAPLGNRAKKEKQRELEIILGSGFITRVKD